MRPERVGRGPPPGVGRHVRRIDVCQTYFMMIWYPRHRSMRSMLPVLDRESEWITPQLALWPRHHLLMGEVGGTPAKTRKLVVGVNDFATVHPELVDEALFDPTSVTYGTKRLMPWKCREGHQWSAQVNNRHNGAGCPVCKGTAVLVGFNDLSTVNPELAAQARFDPTTVREGSKRKLPWICSRGHEWKASVEGRKRGDGCPYCSGRRVIVGETDLATLHPDLATEAQFDASTVTAGSSKKLPWQCSKGHEWSALVVDRANGVGCPYCSGLLTQTGVNDLLTTHPDLAREALFDASTIKPGSQRKLPWRCEKGHEWNETPDNRTRNGYGCPFCSGHRVWPGFNDIATLAPHLVVEARFDATTVFVGSDRRLPWECEHGHEWTESPDNRVRNGFGCPYCSGKRVWPGFNDLATVNPDLAAEAEFDPTTVTAGSAKRMPWRCKLGHTWVQSVSARNRGLGCAYCSGKAVLPGFNDLGTTDPKLAREARFDPTTVTAGSHKKLPWECDAGHQWSAVVASRATGEDNRRGCPTCARTGFNPSETGWVYLLRHESWRMLQVGITNQPKRRLATHAKSGWEVIDIRGPMDGVVVQAWERSILDFLKAQSVPTTPSTATEEPSKAIALRGRRSGEAWWADDFKASTVKELMTAVESWETELFG